MIRKFIFILIKLLIIFSSYYSIYCDDNVTKILIGIHLIVIGVLSILLVREGKKKFFQESETDSQSKTINIEDKSLPDEVIAEITQAQDLWVDIFIFNYWV